MKTQITQYETGATSHAVNDLILYTENTRVLAEMRDRIYKQWAEGETVPHSLHFLDLLKTASFKYRRELGNLTNEQRLEYMDIYANGFEDWKTEHGY
jgi:hypothetical protein